jgi:hypothetical protein
VAEIKWRKSTFSGAANACVELALSDISSLVRDSKRPEAGALRFGPSVFSGFLRQLK